MKLEDFFNFINFINKARAVQRNVKIKDRELLENNEEHSYQLAMVAWYISEIKNEKLNKELILKYALLHDLVEIYAGDTDSHNSSKEFLETKKEREKAALIKIKNEFPSFASLCKTVEDYENLADKEGQIVYVLDKILPVINTFIAEDKYYNDSGITLEKYLNWLNGKIGSINLDKISLKELVFELADFLKKNSKGFFAD